VSGLRTQRKQGFAVRVAGHDNNFDFIRWLAATMVVFSHEYAIVGGAGGEPLAQLTGGFATFGTLGVDIFFVVSGLLVTRSLIERKAIGFFVASRALRIVPALVVVLALSAWVLGPILTDLPLRAYFLSHDAWTYVARNVTFVDFQWGLPGVFLANPLREAVNGPLWTLQPEVQMYGSLLLLGVIAWGGGPRLSRHRAVFVGTGMLAAIAWGWAIHGDLAGRGLEPSTLARLAPYFGLGSLLYLARRAVPITPLSVGAAWGVVVASRGTSLFAPAFAVAVALTTVWLAYSNLGALKRWGRFGDFSYGLYIYAFPVQQTLIALFPSWHRLEHFVATYAATLLCAVLSWRLVEAPSLSLKKRLLNWKRDPTGARTVNEPSRADDGAGAAASAARAPRECRSSSS
jgi:peptidoglycan/LPS O-acetylase OafA/YrhL